MPSPDVPAAAVASKYDDPLREAICCCWKHECNEKRNFLRDSVSVCSYQSGELHSVVLPHRN